MRERAIDEIVQVDSTSVKKRLLKKNENILVGSLAVGRDFPMRVIAEIVDADKMPLDEVIRRGRYYKSQGADIIDIGLSEKDPGKVKELVENLRPLEIPLSIDSMDLENLNEAINSQVDLILSLDRGLIERLSPTDIPVVIIPRVSESSHGGEMLTMLKQDIRLAIEKGFKNPIADPILRPISLGIAGSISDYFVSELTDADSIGLNAALAGVAMECGVSLLFTTEASPKTKGCVRELKTASQMMFLSRKRKTVPKDLGIDLLFLKDKRGIEETPKYDLMEVTAKKGDFTADPMGSFSIGIEENKIRAIHLRNNEADTVVVGESAIDICDTILRLGLISELSHASYLGRELQKAEIGLRSGKKYIQDDSLFSPLF
jgi:dihydropteroate synthase-like protein